ncbi:hypothetical protein Q8F55_008181 [Vanrija albida]|uniref:Uncharacterized protein n=1 Tax=Vanrija albida TaxID=181172 RepID=A0ABR3PVK8_9TREE
MFFEALFIAGAVGAIVHHRHSEEAKRFGVRPPLDYMSAGEAASVPLVPRRAADVVACLEAYHGPPVGNYPLCVVGSYVAYKRHKGTSDDELPSKLELLEATLPHYAAAFSTVRAWNDLPASRVFPPPLPPPPENAGIMPTSAPEQLPPYTPADAARARLLGIREGRGVTRPRPASYQY